MSNGIVVYSGDWNRQESTVRIYENSVIKNRRKRSKTIVSVLNSGSYFAPVSTHRKLSDGVKPILQISLVNTNARVVRHHGSS